MSARSPYRERLLRPVHRPHLALAGLLAGCLGLFGCERPPARSFAPLRSPTAAKSPVAAAQAKPIPPEQATVPAAFDANPAPKEWSVILMGERRVGFGVTSWSTEREGERTTIVSRGFMQLTLEREGQPVRQTLDLSCREDAQGRLLSFTSLLAAGGGETTALGEVQGGKLLIENTTLGKTVRLESPAAADLRGFFAVEQSLAAAPLKPGDSRQVTQLLPALNAPAVAQLTALEWETTPLLTGAARLLKIEQRLALAGQELISFLWVDAAGRLQKAYDPQFQQTTFRCPREEALREVEAGGFDLMTASAAPVKGAVPDFTRSTAVEYLARVTQGELAGVFANDAFQQATVVSPRSVRLRVVRHDANQPQVSSASNGPPLQPPTANDRGPNTLIQSDDPAIVKLAQEAAPGEADALRLAVALERRVHEVVQKKNYSQAFASAAEVARDRTGDCTEHAVLLAALCRARKIPARVVFGLVYYPPQRGFAYHMWNEVWADERWVPLDATLGAGTVGPDHIKLSDSNLAGASPLTALLPVVQVFGRLELEIVRAE